MGALITKAELLESYSESKNWNEGFKCFLEVLIDIRDCVHNIAKIFNDAAYSSGNIGVHIDGIDGYVDTG